MNETNRLRAVIADDEKHIRMLFKKVLTKMNCDVVGEASNGLEAVDLFSRERPDLTLLDINMPFMTGEEALKKIMEISPDAFVIILTSVADAKSIETCISLGAADYIRKDTPLKEMVNLITESWRSVGQRKS